MTFLKKYYEQVIRIDLTNKYSYNNFKDIPKIEKIILNFGCKTSELFNISSALLFLELISQKKAVVTRAKKENIMFKIRKGNIVGCVVVLTKQPMYFFLSKLLIYVFPNLKDFEGIHVFQKKLFKKSFSFTITNFSCFKELEKQFYLFPKLPPLNITILSTAKTEKELLYILYSFKLPLIF
jgi:large subunit ribosomal protein L5